MKVIGIVQTRGASNATAATIFKRTSSSISPKYLHQYFVTVFLEVSIDSQMPIFFLIMRYGENAYASAKYIPGKTNSRNPANVNNETKSVKPIKWKNKLKG